MIKVNYLLKKILPFVIFCSAIFLIGQNLNKPFWGEHDWNGVRYGNIARNYLRYGVFFLKFAQIENSGPLDKKYEYFTHYPPLLPILIAISYRFFGITEWSTRLVPLFATSGIILLIFFIGKKLWDFKTGFLASILSLSIPMVLYFGKTPVHEPLVVFFVSLAFLAFLYGRKILFILAIILAHLTTWAGFFLIPAVLLVNFFRWKRFSKEVLYLPIPVIIFIGYLGLVYLQTGSFLAGDIFGVFLQRSSLLKEVQPTDFNLLNYLFRFRLWLFTLYSPVLTGLVLLWLLFAIRNKFTNSDWCLLMLGIFGITYPIIFPNAVFIHNYLVIYLLPFFTIASARAIWILIRLKFLRKIGILFPAVLFLMILFQTKPYNDALNKSEADKLAILVGKSINQQTKSNEVVLVYPAAYQYSADKFLKFYSDRKLVYSDNVEIGYNVRVLVDQQKDKFYIQKND